METIAILIPTYNNETTIKRAIESALNQTYKNLIIIVLNDASTDNTAEVVQEIIKDNPNVYYFENENNMGRGYSRNKIMDISLTRLSCWLDADDYMDENKIARQYEFFLNNNDCDFLATPMKIFFNDGKIDSCGSTYEKIKEVTLENLIQVNHIPHPTVMFKTLLAKALRFNDSKKVDEDWDFYIRLYILGYKVHVLTDELYYYNMKA
jgi:glycosyltransferase involved in cell wall biosynthesis